MVRFAGPARITDGFERHAAGLKQRVGVCSPEAERPDPEPDRRVQHRPRERRLAAGEPAELAPADRGAERAARGRRPAAARTRGGSVSPASHLGHAARSRSPRRTPPAGCRWRARRWRRPASPSGRRTRCPRGSTARAGPAASPASRIRPRPSGLSGVRHRVRWPESWSTRCRSRPCARTKSLEVVLGRLGPAALGDDAHGQRVALGEHPGVRARQRSPVEVDPFVPLRAERPRPELDLEPQVDAREPTPMSLAIRLEVPSAAMTSRRWIGPSSVWTTTRSGPSATSPTRHGARTSAPAATARSSSHWSSSARVVIARNGRVAGALAVPARRRA